MKLYEKLTSFQKNILDQQEQNFIEIDDYLNQVNWKIPSHLESNVKLKQLDIDGSLHIESNSTEDISLIFNPSASSTPFTIFEKFLPGERISVEFHGSTDGGMEEDLCIHLIQSNNQETVQKDVICLNNMQIIEINQTCEQLKLELTISSKGSYSIHQISITRIPEVVSKDFSGSVKNPFNYKFFPKNIKDLKVACIFDVFTMSCYEKDVQLIPITPENCLFVLEQTKPDILIVESAWKGNDGAWEYKIAEYNNYSNDALKSVIKWCNKQSIPTVFWNKEDPVHFDRFIKSASLFDVIFTTDANMITNYKKVVKHDQIFALPFSAQPILHNPIKIVDKRVDKICFAGSYYDNRHPERRTDMEEILDLSTEFGLAIYDRNYDPTKKGNSSLAFPERFRKNVIGKLPYSQIATAYKGYKVMLNVNSVKYSPTMFSRRIFEGLACGTPIVSTYSEGIRKIFKNLVIISKDHSLFKAEVEKLFSNELYYRSKSLEGIREVLLNHTYKDRIQTICEKSGIHIINKKTTINVVSIIESAEQFNKVLDYFNSQTWNEKKLIIFLRKFDGHLKLFNEYKQTENISCFIYSYMDQYQNIKQIIPSGYIAYMHPTNFYGENYLLDLALAIDYSQADIIGKSCYFKYNATSKVVDLQNKESEYEYVSNLNTYNSIINVNVLDGEDIVSVLSNLESNISLTNYFKKGSKLFSSDCYNFIEGLSEINSSVVSTVEI